MSNRIRTLFIAQFNILLLENNFILFMSFYISGGVRRSYHKKESDTKKMYI